MSSAAIRNKDPQMCRGATALKVTEGNVRQELVSGSAGFTLIFFQFLLGAATVFVSRSKQLVHHMHWPVSGAIQGAPQCFPKTSLKNWSCCFSLFARSHYSASPISPPKAAGAAVKTATVVTRSAKVEMAKVAERWPADRKVKAAPAVVVVRQAAPAAVRAEMAVALAEMAVAQVEMVVALAEMAVAQVEMAVAQVEMAVAQVEMAVAQVEMVVVRAETEAAGVTMDVVLLR
jgi:hypothetical protein